MIGTWKGIRPRIDPTAWVHPDAVLIGDVTIGPRANIWPCAVLRGDQGAIVIGEDTNIQDGSVVHATGGISTVHVGARVTVGHRVILHGCTVGDDCLIGMGSVLLDNAVIGDRCIVAAAAMVALRMVVPPGSMVMGMPAKITRALGEKDFAAIRTGYQSYARLMEEHRAEEAAEG